MPTLRLTWTTGSTRRALVAVGLVSLAVQAHAASYETEIDVIAAKSTEISDRVDEMETATQPGAFLSNAEAITRFQDFLYLHLVGEHGPAAEGFFSLVTTGSLADSGLHRDAEWYLAESLLGMENYRTAEQRFAVIVKDDTHPFREDGVRRLLELYAQWGDKESFRTLYNQEIVQGRVKPTGLITYSLAKSFHQQGDLEDAAGYFRNVESGNDWYGRARYFLGTIAVEQGDLPSAVEYFEEVVDLSIDGDIDRQVHDLALLGLGRIHYHLQDYYQASEFYNRVGGDSVYQADKLYEVIWTSIRRERWRDALNNVEIFLLAYPDHEYTAQLKLLQGHLNFQESNWTDALEAYEQVIADYGPVYDRFSTLSRPDSDAEPEVREVIEDVEGAAGLPPYAVAMMRKDPVLGRAMVVFANLDEERRDIETSERLITDLRGFLSTTGSVGSFEALRLEAIEQRSEIVRQRMALLEAQGEWMAGRAGGGEVGRLTSRVESLRSDFAPAEGAVAEARLILDGYEKRVGRLRAEAAGVRGDADGAREEVETLRTRLTLATPMADDARRETLERISDLEGDLDDARLRLQEIDQQLAGMQIPHILDTVQPQVTDAGFASVGRLAEELRGARGSQGGSLAQRIDAADTLLADSYARLGDVLQGIGQVERSEIGRIRKRFEREVDEVARQRNDYESTLTAARAVSLQLTRGGFGRLEDFFANSILNADMGVVDVYWAQKLEVADELQRVREEKDELVADLERRFKLIREKMGDGK
ncbi:MAG: tetratricopeptide repeat protein [Myxococcales bacterium]|nr:tetratricopeptide repeat protein [Myxococcales bacterium]